MHLPGTKKSEKRKASVVSVEDSEKKEGKREKKKKKKAKSNQRRGEKKAERPTPDPQLQVSSPRSLTTPTAMSPDDRVDSVTESYAPPPPLLSPFLLTNEFTVLHLQPSLTRIPTLPRAAARASRTPCTVSRRHGTRRGRTLSASTGRLCHWSHRRGPRCITRRTG